MISDAAYTALQTEAARRPNPKAVLASALRLYQENYIATQKANPSLTKANIEALQLMPTNIVSILDQSEIAFKREARAATLPDRLGRSFGDAIWNVSLNLVASILFVLISVGVYLSMQDTAQNFFKSLGLDVRTSSPQVEERDPPGEPKKLPSPGENK